MSTVTEWTFTAEVASQINQIAIEHPDLPFRKATVEERSRGKLKRRDLTLVDSNAKILLTGEVKLPDSPEGRTPFQDALVMDAHTKANNEGVEYFFTWNVNRCVLWRTFEQGKPIIERYIEHFELANKIHSSEQLAEPAVQDSIKAFLVSFLERCAAIITGAEPMLWLPLDEKFIVIWESALDPIVREVLKTIEAEYKSKPTFKAKLDAWMRDEQGWTLSKNEELMRENLERAAKFSCYVLANKLIFYKALRRQFSLRTLRIPPSLTTGVQLRKHLHQHFKDATHASKDYETVFDGDFGDSLPFVSDAAVDDWRLLNKETDAFDFTQINYEIIGQIFERMLRGDERHRFGQHYTRSEIVDLINAFCIRTSSDRVLDPACGGGTFLVRAYDRKKALADDDINHADLIAHLYGLDISAYPVHLTTVNLATRDLVKAANYPLVARKDFFTIKPGDDAFLIPADEDGTKQWIKLGKVDCIVGNPPYVRQEKIDEYYGAGYKGKLQDLAKTDAPGVTLSGRSDILCFFFLHAFTLLRDDGYIGLLTSSSWLDCGYGFRLQQFFLDNFEVVAVMESACEPWFTGARVTTIATILHRQSNHDRRANNLVRFVWLKKELSALFSTTNTEEQRRAKVDAFRERIEVAESEEEDELCRIRVLRQGDLYALGCQSETATEYEEQEDDPDGDEDNEADLGENEEDVDQTV
jgi:type I restriction-modification system DNA methylase subunit